MKLNLKHLLIAAFLLSEVAANAQEARHISLDEAVRLSIGSSKQLRLSAARIAEANANLKEANERKLPDVSVQGSYLRLLNTDAEVKIKLGSTPASGGTPTETSSTTPHNVVYGLANVSLPLFAGFKVQSGIESSRYLAEALRLDADKDRQDVIINTTAAYINLYKADEAVRLVQQNLEGAQSRVRDFGNLEQNGLLARNDLLKGELQQSNFELALLDAKNTLRVATINMDLMLGLPESTLITTDSNFISPADTRTLQDWETLALQNRKDVQSLSYREKAAQEGIRYAKSDYYPQLAVTGGYIGAYVENVLTVKDALNVGLGLRYSPSAFWKTGSRVAQAKARLEQTLANEAIISDAIRLQVAQSYEAQLLAAQKIEVYKKAVEQADENYRITNNKYGAQLATATDVLDADVAQLQARLNYAFAKADASLAYQRLLQATGNIPNQ